MQKCRMSKVKQPKEKELFNCKRCGRKHPPKQCPAYGKICAKCKGQNHFAKQCFSKGRQSQKGHVDTVEETDLRDTFFVGMVEQADSSQERTEQTEVNSVAQDKWMTALEINGIIVSLKLDTGAKVNLISEQDVRAMKIKPRINQKTVQLKAYNGQSIPTKGTCRLKVKMKNKEHHLMFVVVPGGHDSVLGDKACEDLGLVKRVYIINNGETQNSVENIVKQFPDIFEGFGVLPFTYKIQLKKDAQPVVHAPRRVPAPLREKLRQELERMTLMGVIEKVEEPTEWVNSMVRVKKANGDLRVCMDPKNLNANV
ncbi:Transposon Ty3-I Gag-Pol [Labeo rohita]|uniref:Transposon Ty3-I Gag-Pol n=1 Tax=Labeo rohita TaxID=84645 RepID=A0A498P2W5_LABRO|nr:Transposon Ty3-I Gag-Pol [Labeo rohita]RXN38541.1 Transposon Ty3-I Gag-Pol [Labeo rohita]